MKTPLALFCLALAGCATLTADSEQTIEVMTNPAGAACSLSNSAGSYTIEKTPGSVAVQRAFEPLDVSCTLAGAGSASSVIESKTRGRAYGNILLGGVPAILDASTGAGYEYTTDSVMLELSH